MKNRINSLWHERRIRSKTKFKGVHEIWSYLESEPSQDNSLYLQGSGYIDFLFDQINRDSPKEYIKSIALIINNCPKYIQYEFYTHKSQINKKQFRILIYCLLRIIVSGEDNPELLVFLRNLVSFLPSSPGLWDSISDIFSVSLLDPASGCLIMKSDKEVSTLLKKSLESYNKLASDQKELAFIAKTWFSKLIKTFMKGDMAASTPFLLLLIEILSYFPTRRFTALFLKRTWFLPLIQEHIEGSLLNVLQYLIYYPTDESQSYCLTYEQSDKIISDRLMHFIFTAFNAYNYTKFVKCTDILTLTKNSRKFAECFGKNPTKEPLINFCKDMDISLMDIGSLSTDQLITCLWYTIADFRTIDTKIVPEINLNKGTNEDIYFFSLFLEANDIMMRMVLELRSRLQVSAKAHINNVLDRLNIKYQDNADSIKISGFSKYAMQLNHVAILSCTSDYLYDMTKLCVSVQIVINFRGTAKLIQREWENIHKNEIIYLIFFTGNTKSVLSTIVSDVAEPTDSRIMRITVGLENNVFDENLVKKTQLVVKPNAKVSSVTKRYLNQLKLSRTVGKNLWVDFLFDEKYHAGSGGAFILPNNIQIDEMLVPGLQHLKKVKTEKKNNITKSEMEKDLMINFTSRESKIDITSDYIKYLGKEIDGGSISLNSKQSDAFIKAMSPGCTCINGRVNTGKTELAKYLLKLYSSEFDERTIVVVASENLENYLMQRLNLDVLVSNLKGKDNSKAIYQSLLKKASNVAKKLGVTDENCEDISSCLKLYYNYIMPIWKNFERELNASNISKDNIFDHFPFIGNDGNLKNCSLEEMRLKAVNAFNRQLNIFRALRSLKFVECLHDDNNLFKFNLTAASKIIIATTTDLRVNDYDLGEFDNLIVMNAECVSLDDLLLIPLKNIPKRIVITGNLFWSNTNSFLYQIGNNVRNIRLTEQYCDEKKIAMTDSPLVLSTNSPRGFSHNLQFIDIKDGREEVHSGQYANSKEAEFVALTFIYMRRMGFNAEQICLLTTSELQKVLIQEMIRNFYQENTAILNDDVINICTVDEMKSSKCDYLLVSLVDTEKHDSNSRNTSLLMCNLLNCGAKGIYIFGNKKTASDMILNLIPIKIDALELEQGEKTRKISAGSELQSIIKSMSS